MNRAKKRSNQVAETYLDSLITLYVEYKNKYSSCSDGRAVVEKKVNDYRLNLELTWKSFCAKNNQSPKRVMNFRPEAFREWIENSLRDHNRLAWFSAVRELCIERYGFEPPHHLIFESFNINRSLAASDPNDGALYCMNFIKSNHPNPEFKFSPFI